MKEERLSPMERFDRMMEKVKARSDRWFEYNRQRYEHEVGYKVDKVDAERI